MLIYMDESGTPGRAISKNDWLLVAFVAFDDVSHVKKLSEKIDNLREKLSLPDNYEFHRVKDKLQIRGKFEHVIFRGNFKIYIIGIKKNQFTSHATFKYIAEQIIASLHGEAKITLDINPILTKEINKAAKKSNKKGIRAKDLNSKKSNLLQVADYVANIAGKCQKSSKYNPPTGYTKRLHFISLAKQKETR